MTDIRPAAFSYINEMEGGHGFTLSNPNGNAPPVFVYPEDHDARQAVKFMHAATAKTLCVMLPGQF